MANILKRPSHAARLGYNGFDMSKRILFTSSVGQLLPVLYDFLNPGDKISVDSSLFTRTQPLRTSAFTRVTEHIDYFFVPMRLINSYWENSFYGISDLGSSALVTLDDNGNTDYPPFFQAYMSLENIVNNLVQSQPGDPSAISLTSASLSGSGSDDKYFYTFTRDSFGVPTVYNFFRLASLLGWSETLSQANRDSFNSSTLPKNLNVNLFYVYQKIYSDYYRLSEWEATRYPQWSQDFAAQDSNGGLNYVGLFGSCIPSSSNLDINPLLKWSPFQLHYRPWKRDFFTNVQSTPQFDPTKSVSSNGLASIDGSIFPLTSDPALSSLLAFETLGIQQPGTSSIGLPQIPSGSVIHGTRPDNAYVTGFQNNLGSLRSAMAWEKLMSITQRAGKHIDDQTLAHFGVKVPQGVSNETYYLGSHSSRLQIGEVVGTATTQDSVLGEIAGRGFGVSQGNKDIKFKAPCHGYLMAIYSAVPEADYQSIGIDRLNALNQPTDFYHPEFDRLGMQPLYIWQSYSGFRSVLPSSMYITGWQYRYSELKSKYDTVHGAFNYTLRDWVAPRQTFMTPYSVSSTPNATFYSWAIRQFYVSPSILDGIFALDFAPVPFDITLSNVKYQVFPVYPDIADKSVLDRNLSIVFERDPLLHSIDFKYYKTSCMSTYGLPNI